jgi:hypothetical protein
MAPTDDDASEILRIAGESGLDELRIETEGLPPHLPKGRDGGIPAGIEGAILEVCVPDAGRAAYGQTLFRVAHGR